MSASLTLPLPQEIRDGLLAAVREAGRTEIMPRFRNLDPDAIETKTSADDLVTIADKRAEVVIAAAARQLMPDALIVGEEAVEEDPSILAQMPASDLTVIIDPIDGTGNYAAGVANFGVIVALMMNGETVFGLLYDPVLDDWIWGEKGQGVWFENAAGDKRKLTSAPAKENTADMYGFCPSYMFSPEEQVRILQGYPKFRRVTALRSSCQEYRQLALGKVDFVLNHAAKPWDHAAGALIALECGGEVVSHDGAPYDPAAPKVPLWTFSHRDKAVQAKIKAAFYD